MVKVIRVKRIQRNSRFWMQNSRDSVNYESISAPHQCQSSNNESILSASVKHSSAISDSVSYKRNNQVGPDDQQVSDARNSIDKINILDSSNNNLFDIDKNEEQARRRKRYAFPWMKLWSCCLICAALILIGLIVAIAILLSRHNSNTTMPIDAIDNTTVATIPTTDTSTFTTSPTTTISQSNWLVNGAAENGPCSANASIVYPKGWNYNGSITQEYYNSSEAEVLSTDPGPNNRGDCFFYGGPLSPSVTSMWQYVNMTGSIDPVLIDNQTVYFNFTAWLGGYEEQQDNAQATSTFLNQTSQQVGSSFTLGPVTNIQRSNQTSLLFRSSNGLVPVGTRSCLVMIKITIFQGTDNDGSIDNIHLHFYQ
ncbi:unnamed protein product [Adineta steineri]|uniref:Uncharacterized protein n=2 Tax=Adineta steineri TaxID=433720 RepID=A0A818TX99_9BILA|nr:unnamed protein product [Adineta steineri]